MEEVRITNDLLVKAKNEAVRRMSFGFRASHSVSENYKFDMIYISCIGELVFQKFLKNNNIAFEFVDFTFPGRELIIKNKKFEIKTSGYGQNFSNLNFIYNDIQYDSSIAKKISYVIQIFVNGYNYQDRTFDESLCSKGTIVGYIEFHRIGNFPIVSNIGRPNYKASLSQLKDIREII